MATRVTSCTVREQDDVESSVHAVDNITRNSRTAAEAKRSMSVVPATPENCSIV